MCAGTEAVTAASHSVGVSIRQPAEDGATPAHFAAASGQVMFLMINTFRGLVSSRTSPYRWRLWNGFWTTVALHWTGTTWEGLQSMMPQNRDRYMYTHIFSFHN